MDVAALVRSKMNESLSETTSCYPSHIKDSFRMNTSLPCKLPYYKEKGAGLHSSVPGPEKKNVNRSLNQRTEHDSPDGKFVNDTR